ncbi:uncharacterized protein LOC143150323 [Ptiloglossa arizonensis]|uniref:uncharacterized protein LOC143150323 n=1 Tax=Ptiloglossa arizonensis TaxID=3350558 RepID=UPI003FA05D60
MQFIDTHPINLQRYCTLFILDIEDNATFYHIYHRERYTLNRHTFHRTLKNVQDTMSSNKRMPTNAETPTTIKRPQPLFIECNGPFLGLDDMPVQIKAPPVSDDEDTRSAEYDFEGNYNDTADETKSNGENARGIDNTSLGERDRPSTNKPKDDLLPSGLGKIKEEPCTSPTPTPSVTNPVTQPTSMFVSVPVKSETESNVVNNVPISGQDGNESSRNIENVGSRINPDQTQPRRNTDVPTTPVRKMRPILPKPIIGLNGEIVRLEGFDARMEEERNEDVARAKEKAMKKKRLDCQRTTLTDTSENDLETVYEKLRAVCPYCHNTYSSERVMNTHFRKYHKNHYRCKKCQYIYESQAILDEHYKVHEKKSNLLQCNSCKNRYKHMWGLKRHQIRAHSTVEPKAIRNENEDGGMICEHECQNQKINRLRTKTYACQHCENAYPAYSHLVAHERITHGILDKRPKEFRCNVCKGYYISEESLRRHAEYHERSFTCNDCGREFREKDHLRKHIRKHTGEKPYQCKVCFRRYAQLGVLRVHKLTHTGERPYVCNICGRSFTQRSSLMIHHRKHPGNHPPPARVSLASLVNVGK